MVKKSNVPIIFTVLFDILGEKPATIESCEEQPCEAACHEDKSVFCNMASFKQYCSVRGFKELCCRSCAGVQRD